MLGSASATMLGHFHSWKSPCLWEGNTTGFLHSFPGSGRTRTGYLWIRVTQQTASDAVGYECEMWCTVHPAVPPGWLYLLGKAFCCTPSVSTSVFFSLRSWYEAAVFAALLGRCIVVDCLTGGVTSPWGVVSYYLVFPHWRCERMFTDQGESERVGLRCEVKKPVPQRFPGVRSPHGLQRRSGLTLCPHLSGQKRVIHKEMWHGDNITCASQASTSFSLKNKKILCPEHLQ